MQRRQVITAHHRCVRRARDAAGGSKVADDHGVDGVIDRLGAGNTAFQQFRWGKLLCPDHAPSLDGGQVTRFGHGCLGFMSWSGAMMSVIT